MLAEALILDIRKLCDESASIKGCRQPFRECKDGQQGEQLHTSSYPA